MKEVLYLADKTYLEAYLKEKASASLEDMIEINAFYKGIEPIIPGSDSEVDRIYSVDGDTAHIKIEGALSVEGPDAWDLFWGYKGCSFLTIQAAMERAKNNNAIKKVILDIDSPGGTVKGTDETWQAHKALADVKPTEVHTGSRLASAAYYISTPASKILACAPTSQVGSIGVIVATYDWSQWEERVGIREVIITSSNAPDKYADISTDKGRNTIRNQLDAIERIFYSRITESRGYDTKHIAEHFGKGAMMVASDPSKDHEDGIRSGLIDGLCNDISVSNNDDIEEFTNQYTDAAINLINQNIPAMAGNKQEGQKMNLSEYLASNPAAAAEIEKIKRDERAAGVKEADDKYSARVAKVLPIIQSASYPDSIKSRACKVLSGETELSNFEGALDAYDFTIEAQKSEQAKNATAADGAPNPEAPNLEAGNKKDSDDAWAKTIEDAKQRKEAAAREVA